MATFLLCQKPTKRTIQEGKKKRKNTLEIRLFTRLLGLALECHQVFIFQGFGLRWWYFLEVVEMLGYEGPYGKK